MNYKRVIFALLAFATLSQSCKQNNNDQAVVASTEKETSTADAQVMPDFIQKDIHGEDMSALDYVKQNKITIIDFWASWCGPCRAEMPKLVSLYEQYKDKGLGILGVSLDNSEEAWKAAVSNMNMTWPQVSDLKGWDNEAAVQFGVQSIPFTMILDQEGHILDTNLRGEALASFISVRLH